MYTSQTASQYCKAAVGIAAAIALQLEQFELCMIAKTVWRVMNSENASSWQLSMLLWTDFVYFWSWVSHIRISQSCYWYRRSDCMIIGTIWTLHDCRDSLAGFEQWKCKQLTVVDVVVDGFCLFLKLDKPHQDLAKLLLVLQQWLHYNWNDLNFAWLPRQFGGLWTYSENASSWQLSMLLWTDFVYFWSWISHIRISQSCYW